MSELILVKEEYYSWPFAWYEKGKLYLTRITDWFAVETISHESMHLLLDKMFGSSICHQYDRICDFVERSEEEADLK